MRAYLETERMVLRQLIPDDVDDLVALDGDPAVMRYLTGGRPTPRHVVRNEFLPRMLREYRRRPGFGIFAANERSGDEEFLGWFEFRSVADEPADPGVELGFRLRRVVWGKGYATEGARALVRHGFAELGVARVRAETMAVHRAARRVLEKAGLRELRTVHRSGPEPIPGAEHGEVIYALERAEWDQPRRTAAP